MCEHLSLFSLLVLVTACYVGGHNLHCVLEYPGITQLAVIGIF